MASADVRQEALSLRAEIAAEAVAVRKGQEAAYNQWAIDQVEKAAGEWGDAKAWLDEDEAKFMATLEKTLGVVDTALMHPAVGTLYAEVYQKLIGELSAEQKVAATRSVEEARKKTLSDF